MRMKKKFILYSSNLNRSIISTWNDLGNHRNFWSCIYMFRTFKQSYSQRKIYNIFIISLVSFVFFISIKNCCLVNFTINFIIFFYRRFYHIFYILYVSYNFFYIFNFLKIYFYFLKIVLLFSAANIGYLYCVVLFQDTPISFHISLLC